MFRLLLYIMVLVLVLSPCRCWLAPIPGPFRKTRGGGGWSPWIAAMTTIPRRAVPDPDEVVDVDFERVSYEERTASRSVVAESDDEAGDSKGKTLLDLALESEPQMKEVRIPFCQGDDYIDGKLAFTVDLEGVTYGIAVPFDDAVGIFIQERLSDRDENGDFLMKITYVDPDLYGRRDNDEEIEQEELMEIMAAQVQQQLGEELWLRKTPKVLTISGGLDKLTKNWEERLLPKSASIEELLETVSSNSQHAGDEDDPALTEFLDFMKQELGEEEFNAALDEDLTPEEEELAKFFEVPGAHNGEGGVEDLLQSIKDDLETNRLEELEEQFRPDTDGSALKLIAYELGGGRKSYLLVKFLQPYVLVGKYDGADEPEDIDDADEGAAVVQEQQMLRFELLTEEEEAVLIPKLEELCQGDLEAAGLSFQKPPTEEPVILDDANENA